jgi:putative ABC transport system permease protein
VDRIDPALPLYWVRSLEQQYRMDSWFFRAFGTLFTIFGVAALALAVAGLYGVMSFSVTQRTREIGVRMALGSQPQNILKLVMEQGSVQLAIGALLGLAFAGVLARAVQMMLFGVRPWDPLVYVVVVVTLSIAGVAACLIPAARAMRLDPVDALRYE